jgi:hypothetical protein
MRSEVLPEREAIKTPGKRELKHVASPDRSLLVCSPKAARYSLWQPMHWRVRAAPQ